ncbi:hypothetical protein [Pseudomonas aeruginosa]|uniref:hypothetical protein n=2 Tax=Pseudomonas aeruginosa TaxID=287 RepID=UPI0021E7797E|nr:hypothetical protein [Pseudomonas aeruginosa]MCV3976404.1 hypothetical protein [Pseudomonas aeruginosa]
MSMELNKANECTCPSGDGSLRWPCPKHPAVEQAGANVGHGHVFPRADGVKMRCGGPGLCSECTADASRARAALAQPSPTLPPFAEKVLAKLRRFYDCAEDFESGGVDIGRHWLDLLTQLGLLNRVQRSPALWEISQQGEDLLGTPHPSPAQAEKAEAERQEVASLTADLYEIAERILEIAEGRPKAISTTLMAPVRDYRLKDAKAVARVMGERLVALADRYVHHDRVVGALRFERQQMDRAFTACINERDAANARLHEVATACATAEQERDAALAEVEALRAELQSQRERNTELIFKLGSATNGWGRCEKERDAAQARCAELKAELAMANDAAAKGDAARHQCAGMEMEIKELRGAAEHWEAESRALQKLLDAALAKLAELEKQEPVAAVSEETFSANGTSDIITRNLPIGTTLYAAPVAPAQHSVPQAWLDVQAERRRQITAEGWTPEHDDEHSHGQMARAAACYALAGSSAPNDGTAALLVSLAWPWDEQWWKPTTTRRDLVKACALGLAEIERLDRAAAPGKEVSHE